MFNEGALTMFNLPFWSETDMIEKVHLDDLDLYLIMFATSV